MSKLFGKNSPFYSPRKRQLGKNSLSKKMAERMGRELLETKKKALAKKIKA